MQEKVSAGQLASIIVLFQIGSSSLFLLASDAKHDAWISVLIAMLMGLVMLVLVIMPIQAKAPEASLIEILNRYFGKYLGFILGLSFIAYFIYKSLRNVREFGDLVILYMLPRSSLDIIMFVLMCVGAYAIYHGMEVFFRVGQLVLPWLLLIYIVLFVLLFASDLVDLRRLLPLLEHGWKPVWDAAIPEVVSFPFGEMVVFLMFWKHLASLDKFKKFSLISYVCSGLFIVLTNVLIITVLGDKSGAYVVPFMFSTSLIQIGGFVERMDPFVSLLLFGGVFFKQATYYLAAVLAASELFKVKHRTMIIPVGAAIFIGARLFQSYIEQIRVGFDYNLKLHYPIFQIILPIMLVLIMMITHWIKRWRKQKDQVSNPPSNE